MTNLVELEAELRRRADDMTVPVPEECLLCYVARMTAEFGCDSTLRWARRWRDLRLPRDRGLEKRLGRAGGFCDCEIFTNGWCPAVSRSALDDEGDLDEWPDPLPSCTGGSGRPVRACPNWRFVR